MHGAPGRREKKKQKVLLLILAWWGKHLFIWSLSPLKYCSTIIPGYPLVPSFRKAAYLYPKKKKKTPFFDYVLSSEDHSASTLNCLHFHTLSLISCYQLGPEYLFYFIRSVFLSNSVMFPQFSGHLFLKPSSLTKCNYSCSAFVHTQWTKWRKLKIF